MPTITPCLWFDNQAEEAAKLYTRVVPNSAITAVTHYPIDTPGGKAGEVMTVEFTLDGRPYTGLNGGPQFPFTEAVSFQIDCADQRDVDWYWSELTADGGSEGPCGWLKDRFGLSWQIVPRRLTELLADPDPQVARRVSEQMMTMGKLDIAPLEAAAEKARG
ncbi:VOC family protein [Mycobacterium sp. pUA109]|uniref:VOC family protein n=1 Tax=Mycobacterium sp. pUA109 TaxID=3238982 RepID=UPI00351B6CEA